MNLHEFLEEYDGLTDERRVTGLQRFFDELARDPEQYEDFILDLLNRAAELEQDDYFGTEGARL